MHVNDILSIAKSHSIHRDIASPDFFEGALMGNGDLGVVVCTRPDGIVLHLGHNSIWDIRIAEDHKDVVGTFDELWARVLENREDIRSQEWFQQYTKTVTDSYKKHVYPRPYPASSLYLFFDRKRFEVLGHSLDLSCGLLTVSLEDTEGAKYAVQIVVSMEKDVVCCRTLDGNGDPAEIFCRMHLVPHQPDGGLPDFTVLPNGFVQLLPYNDFDGKARPGVDKGFSVLYRTNGSLACEGLQSRMNGVSEVTVQVTQGYFDQVEQVKEVSICAFDGVREHAAAVWAQYWQLSGVKLADAFLERIWYVNTYFMRCVLSAHSRCPGLFGNWMLGNIGTAWHGDYHMNYNTQQIFWGLMGANRQELHLPYVDLVEFLMPVSTAWAKDFYHMNGACFPHSAYPVPMTVNPFPAPGWGWEIFETPWTVQSLWWHYTYTQDQALLRDRLYPCLRAAAQFMVEYMLRDGANPVGDDQYHLYPIIVPELYGLSDGLKHNLDGTADLAFTKFLFKAMLQAAADLEMEQEEAELLANIRKILAAYPAYPTASSRFGEVYVSVANEDPDSVVYNVPANLIHIFPGEDVDAQTASEAEYELARRSWLHHYNEGGNDLVFYHLAGARLGMLDMEKFKRQVRYSLLPNETAADRATLAGGRYGDTKDLDFMTRMGIWVENFSLYAVINECLLWGHTDLIELFPNWDRHQAAEFCSLRTKGAFLVDAACADGSVCYVRITAECGGTAKLKNPWRTAVDEQGRFHEGEVLALPLEKGESILLKEA